MLGKSIVPNDRLAGCLSVRQDGNDRLAGCRYVRQEGNDRLAGCLYVRQEGTIDLPGVSRRGKTGTIDSPGVSRSTESVARLSLTRTIDLPARTIDSPSSSRRTESVSRQRGETLPVKRAGNDRLAEGNDRLAVPPDAGIDSVACSECFLRMCDVLNPTTGVVVVYVASPLRTRGCDVSRPFLVGVVRRTP
jgi:hypothetical protein